MLHFEYIASDINKHWIKKYLDTPSVFFVVIVFYICELYEYAEALLLQVFPVVR